MRLGLFEAVREIGTWRVPWLPYFVAWFFLVIGVTTLIQETYFAAFTQETAGVVVDVAMPFKTRSRADKIIVEYSIGSDKKYRIKGQLGNDKIGDVVKVEFWESSPQDGFVKTGIVPPAFMTVFAALMLLRRTRLGERRY